MQFKHNKQSVGLVVVRK